MRDPWLWVERAAWLVSIIGIPGVLIGLLRMARHANLVAGFLPRRRVGRFRRVETPSSEVGVGVTFRQGAELSEPFPVHFIVMNIGRATARERVFNFKFPVVMDANHVTVPDDAKTYFGTDPEDGRLLWTYRDSGSYMHPKSVRFVTATMRVPREIGAVEVDAELIWADADPVRRKLRIRVVRQPSHKKGLAEPQVAMGEESQQRGRSTLESSKTVR